MASSITGAPGTAISTIETSSWPGRTDGQPPEVRPDLGKRNILAHFHSDLLGPVLQCDFLVVDPQVGACDFHHGHDATVGRRRPSSPRVLSWNPGVGGRTGVALEDATRYPGVYRRRRHAGAVGGRRQPVHPGEARGEGPDALQADHHADVGDRPVGVAQQRRGPFQAPCLQIRARGFAERPGEHPAEMGPGQSGGRGQIVDRDRPRRSGRRPDPWPAADNGRAAPRHALSLFARMSWLGGRGSVPYLWGIWEAVVRGKSGLHRAG